MKTIRILHIVGTMNQGGAETLIMELYRHIDRSKVQFDFFVYDYSGKGGVYDNEIQELGGHIYLAKRKLSAGIRLFYEELICFFKEHPNYQIIHAHQYTTSGYILSAAKRAGVKVKIAHSHAGRRKVWGLRACSDYIGKILIRKNADYIFGCSEDALLTLAGRKSDGTKVFRINNAINISKFLYSEDERELWRKRFAADSETLIVGCVGGFRPVKNHRYLLEIFQELIKLETNSLLVFVGIGETEDEIRQKVEEYKLEDKVYFMGNRFDVNDIMNAFDIFVLPSKGEGLGIVYVEAQANGLCCLMSADVVPNEADLGAGLVTRLSINDDPKKWAIECLAKKQRIDKYDAENFVREAGYDIKETARWLQSFYLKYWDK